MTKKGKWIVFEGIDGAGKSSLCRAMLADVMARRNASAIKTFEPTENAFGKMFRARMKEHLTQGAPFSVQEQIQLLVRDRMAHYSHIQKWISDGIWVIQDRFWHSTVAYQDFEIETLIKMHEILFWPGPDLVCLVHLPLEEAFARLEGRGDDDEFKPLMERAQEIYSLMDQEFSLFDLIVSGAASHEVQLQHINEFLDNQDRLAKNIDRAKSILQHSRGIEN